MLYSIVKDVRPVHLSFMGLAIFLLKTDRNLLSVRFWKSYGDGLFIASIFFSYLYRAHNNINIVNWFCHNNCLVKICYCVIDIFRLFSDIDGRVKKYAIKQKRVWGSLTPNNTINMPTESLEQWPALFTHGLNQALSSGTGRVKSRPVYIHIYNHAYSPFELSAHVWKGLEMQHYARTNQYPTILIKINK